MFMPKQKAKQMFCVLLQLTVTVLLAQNRRYRPVQKNWKALLFQENLFWKFVNC